jgi:DNA-binding IclR family transcriptional regulator
VDPVLGNREIADRTGLPKPTVSRLTYTLTLLGYLSRVDRAAEIPPGLRRAVAGLPAAGQHAGAPDRAAVHGAGGARDRLHRQPGHARPHQRRLCRHLPRADQGNLYQPDIGSTRPLLSTSMGRALVLAAARRPSAPPSSTG